MIVRDYHFNLEEKDIFSYGRSKPVTRLLNSLSLLFPKGERFFIESIRKFEKQINDPQLREDIKIFYQQEGRHGREHRKLNAHLQSKGLDIEKIEKQIMRRLNKYALDEQHELLVTVCLERMTGFLGHVIPLIDDMILKDNEYAALWRYHALEEVEHVHVAEDVMKRVGTIPKGKDWYYMILGVKELAAQVAINYTILKRLEEKTS